MRTVHVSEELREIDPRMADLADREPPTVDDEDDDTIVVDLRSKRKRKASDAA